MLHATYLYRSVLPKLCATADFICSRHSTLPCYAMAKQLHFNKDGSALKKMQAGVDKLASVVGITLGPKVSRCLACVKHATS